MNKFLQVVILVGFHFLCRTCSNLTSLDEQFQEKMQNYTGSIYFLFTDANRQLSTMATCAIQTAALINPRASIILLSQSNLTLPDLLMNVSSLHNIKNEVLTFESLLKFSPTLLTWYRENKLLDRKNFKADLSDALRFALLSSRGGAYLDTDMISLKPISYIPMNSLGKQLLSQDRKGKVPLVNGAAMLFEKHSPYINECISKFNESYNPKKFGTVGPELLWKSYQMLNSSGTAPNLLESNVFYPVKFRSHTLKAFFVDPAVSQPPWFPETTVAVHFWSHLSSRFKIEPHSKGGTILSRCGDVNFLKSLTGKQSQASTQKIYKNTNKVNEDTPTSKKKRRKKKASSQLVLR